MHKSRWQEYLKKQKDLFEEYSDIAFLKRQGQAEIEERIQNREPYTTYDQDTHGSIENFQEFLQNLKTITTNEDGVEISSISDETKERITSLVKDVIGFNEDRGDSLTVSSAPFVATLEGVNQPWYELDWIQKGLTQAIMVILLGIVTFGVLRPLVNRIIVPIDAGRPGEPISGTDDDEVDLDKVTVQEGETLEDIKAKLKPKKQTISAEMLDTANTYDDKVAVIRMIVSDEAGRVSNVFKTMMKKDIGI